MAQIKLKFILTQVKGPCWCDSCATQFNHRVSLLLSCVHLCIHRRFTTTYTKVRRKEGRKDISFSLRVLFTGGREYIYLYATVKYINISSLKGDRKSSFPV